MEFKSFKSIENDKLWKEARWGVIIFCIAHLIYEGLTGNTKSAAFPVVINFFLSSWYIKSRIEKGKILKNPLLTGLTVSGVIFLVRLAFGMAMYLIMVG
jgi:hypothetical protein